MANWIHLFLTKTIMGFSPIWQKRPTNAPMPRHPKTARCPAQPASKRCRCLCVKKGCYTFPFLCLSAVYLLNSDNAHTKATLQPASNAAHINSRTSLCLINNSNTAFLYLKKTARISGSRQTNINNANPPITCQKVLRTSFGLMFKVSIRNTPSIFKVNRLSFINSLSPYLC